MVAFRRKQARASVVVEVMSPKSAALVHHACSRHGTVEKMFHYTYREKVRSVILYFYLNNFKSPFSIH